MALIDQNNLMKGQAVEGFKSTKEAPAVEADKPGLGETIGAAFRQENPLANVSDALKKDRVATNKDFDPFDSIDGYEQYAKEFVYADSQEEVDEVKAKIDKEIDDRRILEEAGWVGVVSRMAAGVLDPTILIPGTAAVKAVTKGARIAKGAAGGAALGATALGVQEGTLQAGQRVRTVEESAIAIAAGGILGGVVGGAIGGLSKGVKVKATKEIEDILNGTPPKPLDITNTSVGAAEAGIDTAGEGIAGLGKKAGKVAATLTGDVGVLETPVIRGLKSESGVVRKLTNDIFEHNILLNKTKLEGEAGSQAVETFMKLDQAKITRLNTEIENLYLKSVGAGGTFGRAKAAVGSIKAGKARFDEFNEQVAKALRRGDEHAIPEVAQAAKLIRKEMDEATSHLQRLGLLGDDLDVKTAKTYFSRKWNHKAIKENRAELHKRTARFLKRENPKMDDVEIEVKADDIIDNILRQSDAALGMDNVAQHMQTKSAKFTKDRVFMIPDEEVEDFLVSDAVGITTGYLHKASALRRFGDMLERNGYESLADIKKALKAKLDRDMIKNPDHGTELNKRFTKDLEIIDDHVAIILGQYHNVGGKLDPAFNTLRRYQFLRLLGGVTLSSLPDIAMPVLRHGLPRTVKAALKSSITNIRGARLAKQEMKALGVGLEIEESMALRMIADPSFTPAHGVSQKIGDKLTEGFGKVSGITYWNNMGKRQAGFISSDRSMSAIMKGAARRKGAETLRLRKLGIDEAMEARIKVQNKKFGSKKDGVHIANFDKWSDVEAREAYGAALVKDVDSTIITPGRGDIPLFVQKSGIGKVMFQFKSFASAASNKILLPAMQDRDANTLMGLLMLIYMGTVVTDLKDMVKGKKIKEKGIWESLGEGMSRSGVTGLMGDMLLAVNPYGETSRFATRNVNSFALGASGNLVGDLYGVAKSILDGDMTEAEKKKLIRMLPFSNIFWLQAILKRLGD